MNENEQNDNEKEVSDVEEEENIEVNEKQEDNIENEESKDIQEDDSIAIEENIQQDDDNQDIKKEKNEEIETDDTKEENNQEEEKKKKKQKIWKYVLRITILFIILLSVYMAAIIFVKNHGINSIFKNIEDEETTLSEYIVYGTHLNIKGSLKINDTKNISALKLCFKSTDHKNENEYNLKYSVNQSEIEFYSSDLINEGIDLEKFNVDMYYMLLKVSYTDNIDKYYSIKNNTKYNEITYYTITKNDKNIKIHIGFDIHNKDKKDINYMYLNAIYAKLPEDVYDIVIDPRTWRKGRWG